MLDPIQIPILLKAIDFIFDEGHKLLEERRARQQTSEASAASAASAASSPAQSGDVPEPPAATEERSEIKRELLSARIDEILWKNHEAEVQHLVRLLETYSRNYHLASEQYAKWGSALVPPIIAHNLTEAENSIAVTLKKLEDVLSKVYEKDVTPDQ